MTIFLPSRDIPLSSFPLLDQWQEWRTFSEFMRGFLELPRFKVEYEVTLNEALQALGMAEAFSQDQADFSHIAKVPKSQNIYISEVKHKTFVEVNEEGTEAAAVIFNDCEGAAFNPIPPFEMIVDHPFLFTIQDDSTGTVLFLGAIVEPK